MKERSRVIRMKAKDTDQLPRIVFLLGAGASRAAGMPTTEEITNKVLSCRNIRRNDDGSYSRGNNNDWSEQYLRRVRVMLGLLKGEVIRFYSRRPATGKEPFNYEDLYYVARQIENHELGAQDNPAILPLIDRLLPPLSPLFIAKEDETTKEEWSPLEISRETVRYIKDVVREELKQEPSPAKLTYLDFLKEAWQACQAVDIFTLNHDKVLDHYLEKEGIPFMDGFGKEKDGVRDWEPSLYEGSSGKVRLFKLHGGVDWYRCRPNDCHTALDDQIYLYENPGQEGPQTPWLAKGLTLLEGHPEILIGTYNKMVDYASEVFIDLHHMFYQSLLSTHHVIICGYSFGDHGINKMLDTWIKKPDRRLVVVDPGAETFKNRTVRWDESRIPECWDELKSRGILKCISKRIEDVSWEEIKKELYYR